MSELNKLGDNAYTLNDFKSLECKVLVAFNFDLIRPTAATFTEYFGNSFITLHDFIYNCQLLEKRNDIEKLSSSTTTTTTATRTTI